MTKKLIIPNTKKPASRTNVPMSQLRKPQSNSGNNIVINNNVYSNQPQYGGRKFTKRFRFFNPIMIVMLVASCIFALLGLLVGYGYSDLGAGAALGIYFIILQLYFLFPAWIAFGRDCKHKEFILFTCIVFLGFFALIWALVGEKKEYDYPV